MDHVRSVIAKAHKALSHSTSDLAGSFRDAISDSQLLPLKEVFSKIDGVYAFVCSRDWTQTRLHVWSWYTFDLANATPSWTTAMPMVLLLAPVR